MKVLISILGLPLMVASNGFITRCINPNPTLLPIRGLTCNRILLSIPVETWIIEHLKTKDLRTRRYQKDQDCR